MRDYAELVQRLRYSADGLKSCDECNGECRGTCIFTEAADAIEELLAAVPHWISVEERLPEGKGDYWCNVRSYNFDDTYYQHEVWFDGESFVIDGVCTDRVTHWMPLPAPPEDDIMFDDEEIGR